MELTADERAYLDRLSGRLGSLRRHLNDRGIPGPSASARDWCDYLSAMKAIVGNAGNDLSFVATLMAKQYLYRALRMKPFDVAAKAQGAPGLDIDGMTLDGERVIGEIKTTVPYLEHDLGAAQTASFEKDFAKLNAASADHKFFFVTDDRTFRVMKRRCAARIPGVTIVLLTTGDRYTIRRPDPSG